MLASAAQPRSGASRARQLGVRAPRRAAQSTPNGTIVVRWRRARALTQASRRGSEKGWLCPSWLAQDLEDLSCQQRSRGNNVHSLCPPAAPDRHPDGHREVCIGIFQRWRGGASPLSNG